MQIPVEQLSALVAIYLGEYPAFRYNADVATNSVALQEMVVKIAENLITPMTERLPIEQCTDIVDFAGYIYENSDPGYENTFPCPLPKDFLRLHSLWMPDWGNPIGEESPPDTLRQQLGDTAPDWLATRTSRPIYRIIDMGGGSKELWFGPTKHRRPRAACYVPRPEFDRASDTFINLQPALLDPLAAKIAETISD